MILLGKKTSWPEIKKVISQPNFIDSLVKIDKDNIQKSKLTKLKKLTTAEQFKE